MSDLVFGEVQNMNQLFNAGLYFKALDALHNFEQKIDITTEDQLSCHILKSNIFYELGRYTDALEFAEKAFNMSQELGNKLFLIDSCISKALALLGLRDFDLASQVTSKGEELLKNLTIKPQSEFAKRDALLKLIKSELYLYKSGNIDKALEYGEQSLKISDEKDNLKEIVLALQQNSVYYMGIGNLDRALDYLEIAYIIWVLAI
jgi:tetratricopeptide (TPR) repeat protein